MGIFSNQSIGSGIRTVLAGLAVVVCSAGFASAATISLVGNSIVQTANFGGTGTATDVGYGATAETFQDFTAAAAAAGAPVGSVLSSVYLQESINEAITGLTIAYTTPQAGNNTGTEGFVYEGTAQFLISGTAPDATNLASSPQGILFSIGDSGVSVQNISFDTYLNYIGTPPPAIVTAATNGAGTIDPTQIGALANDVGNGLGNCLLSNGAPPFCNDLTPWTYTTSYTDSTPSSAYVSGGPFTLDYRTITTSTFIGGGGNLDAAQTTTTDANMEVIYNFTTTSEPDSIPEPASMVLMGSALLGLGLLGRRRKNAARS